MHRIIGGLGGICWTSLSNLWQSETRFTNKKRKIVSLSWLTWDVDYQSGGRCCLINVSSGFEVRSRRVWVPTDRRRPVAVGELTGSF